MTTNATASTDWLKRVQTEYLEMPGLCLTSPQIRRLWGLEDGLCDELLGRLVAEHFLRRTAQDVYVLDDLTIKGDGDIDAPGRCTSAR
jgi:hypothetical protein